MAAYGNALDISIHALLAESDVLTHRACTMPGIFLSTLSLRRATADLFAISARVRLFLSTLSLRRATTGTFSTMPHKPDFYPRSPCGERRFRCVPVRRGDPISIHALLAESDVAAYAKACRDQLFLSTLSLRRATGESFSEWSSTVNFYPRSPCGERPGRGLAWLVDWLFLSTLSLRRATQIPFRCAVHTDKFLSTLSLRRATRWSRIFWHPKSYFYPRSPCGERLHYDNYNLHCVEISIHALLAESDVIFVILII